MELPTGGDELLQPVAPAKCEFVAMLERYFF